MKLQHQHWPIPDLQAYTAWVPGFWLCRTGNRKMRCRMGNRKMRTRKAALLSYSAEGCPAWQWSGGCLAARQRPGGCLAILQTSSSVALDLRRRTANQVSDTKVRASSSLVEGDGTVDEDDEWHLVDDYGRRLTPDLAAGLYPIGTKSKF
jgi:hypothetical protein